MEPRRMGEAYAKHIGLELLILGVTLIEKVGEQSEGGAFQGAADHRPLRDQLNKLGSHGPLKGMVLHDVPNLVPEQAG